MTADAPHGRSDVVDALVTATIDLIIDEGLALSVRQIAARAGVNHGLVHTYFGSKEGLMRAAFDQINELAAAEIRPNGYPPVDLPMRHDGRLARAIARVMLDGDHDLFSTHPITVKWDEALRRDRPDESENDRAERMVITSALALGWALFADYLMEVSTVEGDLRERLDRRVRELTADLGGIPPDDG